MANTTKTVIRVFITNCAAHAALGQAERIGRRRNQLAAKVVLVLGSEQLQGIHMHRWVISVCCKDTTVLVIGSGCGFDASRIAVCLVMDEPICVSARNATIYFISTYAPINFLLLNLNTKYSFIDYNFFLFGLK